MKVTLILTEKEIEKLDQLIGIADKEFDEDIADAIHLLIQEA